MTEQMMAKMVHAIGLDQKEPENNVYTAYRRSSFYYEPDEVWESLVAEGYARLVKRSEREYIYVVTEKGFQAIADAKRIMIRYTLEFDGM